MSAAHNKSRYDRLWRALRQCRTPPGEILPSRELPLPGELPCPWTVWTLIGLVRHRRRQLWVGDVVASRLGGDMGQIAACGALGHPESRPQAGVVPGLVEWEYFFHGRGCCLTHRVTGEAVDVDFFGDDAERFEFDFYLNYLHSLKDPPPPERRLIDLHASLDPIRLAFDELRADGLLVADAGCEAPRLSDEVLAHESEVDGFCAAWDDPPRRPWLAALVGDWLAADELTRGAGDHRELASLAADRAALLRGSGWPG